MLMQTARNLAAAILIGLPAIASAAQVIEVYKSARCGCCEAWVEHLRLHGLTVKAHDVASPSDVRAKMGIPDRLGSCHTALIGGYAIEGHVPAADILRLMAEQPKAKGLAVPAMPPGSPGMEGPRHMAFDVLLVRDDGTTTVFKHDN